MGIMKMEKGKEMVEMDHKSDKWINGYLVIKLRLLGYW